jgi:hypothetical protein
VQHAPTTGRERMGKMALIVGAARAVWLLLRLREQVALKLGDHKHGRLMQPLSLPSTLKNRPLHSLGRAQRGLLENS